MGSISPDYLQNTFHILKLLVYIVNVHDFKWSISTDIFLRYRLMRSAADVRTIVTEIRTNVLCINGYLIVIENMSFKMCMRKIEKRFWCVHCTGKCQGITFVEVFI